jgi:hypothetical protein
VLRCANQDGWLEIDDGACSGVDAPGLHLGANANNCSLALDVQANELEDLCPGPYPSADVCAQSILSQVV